eukprot:193329-Chlamydomonas_euryale.AAC.4
MGQWNRCAAGEHKGHAKRHSPDVWPLPGVRGCGSLGSREQTFQLLHCTWPLMLNPSIVDYALCIDAVPFLYSGAAECQPPPFRALPLRPDAYSSTGHGMTYCRRIISCEAVVCPSCNWPRLLGVTHLMFTLLGPWPPHFDAAYCWRLLH